MENFFEYLMKEAIKRDIKNDVNRNVKKPFERVVSLEFEGKNVKVKTLDVCLN